MLAQATSEQLNTDVIGPTTDASVILPRLGKGDIDLLIVNRLDLLSDGVRRGVIEKHQRARGLFATAEQLSASELAAIEDPDRELATLTPIEERPNDLLAIADLLWTELGHEPSLVAHLSEPAANSLCKGPYRDGVPALRRALGYLADALVSSGVLQGGTLLRPLDAADINEAVLDTVRSTARTPVSGPRPSVIVVEGSTDVAYLSAAAAIAAREHGWNLLDGCELMCAGENRGGGATEVWTRLIELRGESIESIGLFDNDDVGRRGHKDAKDKVPVELLPAEFDRLGLTPEHRGLEIEDLLDLRVLIRFYEAHPEREPEEIRICAGSRFRIVPEGKDKHDLAQWASAHMAFEECERVVFCLCQLRRRLRLPVPRADLDEWLRSLVEKEAVPTVQDLAPVLGLERVRSPNPEQPLEHPEQLFERPATTDRPKRAPAKPMWREVWERATRAIRTGRRQ